MGTLFARLDQQWEALAADPELQHATADILEMAGAASDWLDAQAWMRSHAVHPEDKNRVLSALVRRAHVNDRAAAACLALLMPGIVAEVGRHYRRLGHRAELTAEVEASAIEIAWRLIRTFPRGRPGNVAANILLDLRKQLLGRPVSVDELLTEPWRLPVIAGPPAKDWSSDLIELVEHAQRFGWITVEEGEAILATRVHGEPQTDAAARRSLSSRTFRRLQRGAEAHLAEFARRELAA